MQRVKAKKGPKIEQLDSKQISEEEIRELEEKGLAEEKKREEPSEKVPDWKLFVDLTGNVNLREATHWANLVTKSKETIEGAEDALQVLRD